MSAKIVGFLFRMAPNPGFHLTLMIVQKRITSSVTKPNTVCTGRGYRLAKSEVPGANRRAGKTRR